MLHRSYRPLAAAALVSALAFLAFMAVRGLEPTGRDLVVIAFARVGFLAGLAGVLLAFPVMRAGRLARTAAALAVGGTAAFLVGAVSHVVIDGWSYNPFLVEGSAPPWYSFVIGLGGFAFAGGAALAGVAALRRGVPGPLALSLLLGGVTYALAIPLAAIGHVAWTLPWLLVGGLLLLVPAEARPTASSQLVGRVHPEPMPAVRR